MPRLEERIAALVGTVNEELLDRAIRHSLFLERLKTHEVDVFVGFLNDEVVPDLVERLERRLARISTRGFDTSPASTRRIREMLAGVNQILRQGLRRASQSTTARLHQIAATEAQFQASLFRTIPPIDLEVLLPGPRLLQSIITQRPMQGQLLSAWWQGLSQAGERRVSSAITNGLVQGESTDEIVRRVRGTRAARFQDGAIQTTRTEARTVVRTAVNHVTTQARELTYQENGDMIKGVRYIATLDSRTSLICAGLDGKLFPVDSGPRPPMHPQCRSTTVPVLKSWKELGISLPDAPAGTRASMDGQVPDSLTYGAWLRRQPVHVQDEALGKARARLFRSGKVRIDRFTDVRYQPLTLEELRRREGLE